MPSYSPRLPIHLGQWLFVADFVAVHSCEGSGGFTPRFPLTSGASCFIKDRSCWKHEANRNLLRSNNPDFTSSIQLRDGKNGFGGSEFSQQKIRTPSISYEEDRGRHKNFTVRVIR